MVLLCIHKIGRYIMNEPTFSNLIVRYQADTDSWVIPCDDGQYLYVRRDMIQYAPDDVYAIVSERVKRFQSSMMSVLSDPPRADVLQFPVIGGGME
jgi:hypothetical protein